MKKILCMVLGILSGLYGILILQVGSGTGFWIIWEGVSVFFLLWAFLIHKKILKTHKKIRLAFHGLLTVSIAVLVTLCGLITTGFVSKENQNLDYLIVLGAQVRENGPSTILRYRLDAAISYLQENPETICIVSGGQGVNEPFSEAEGMLNYLVSKGILRERIIMEGISRNTVENIRYSKVLITKPEGSVGIVTNNFHIFRAVRIAKAQGLEDVYGISAYSHPLYLPNNVLRECCGILKDWLLQNL